MQIQPIVLSSRPEPPSLDRGSIFFVGTATTVIRCGGFTILTDPNFLHAGDHAHLGYGMTSERLTDPAVDVEELPPLDLCILSHLHGDHWDRVAAAKLRKDLPIVTTAHAAAGLREQGFTHVHALDTWDSVRIVRHDRGDRGSRGNAALRITSMPGKHAPGLLNPLLPPVMGSLLEWTDEKGALRFRLYISGDTLVHDDLAEIPRRFPDIDLALLHLGGTRLFGVLLTMDAKQGIQALRIIQPRAAIPIHYNDYPVFKSPVEDFLKAVESAGLKTRVHYLRHGDTYGFTVPEERTRAWRPAPMPTAKEQPAEVWKALGSGTVGAVALTALHETARRVLPNAPRADLLGERAIDRSLRALGRRPPSGPRLHRWALAGDLLSSSLFYSLVGSHGGRKAWLRGSLLGLGAGLGVVVLPGPLGLGSRPSARTPATVAMTLAWYVAGGLAAAAAVNGFERWRATEA
jgi:L-ascorbate metabolism protein UlaG (beta-lactamase superfamily)